jgi:hypothetical protein
VRVTARANSCQNASEKKTFFFFFWKLKKHDDKREFERWKRKIAIYRTAKKDEEGCGGEERKMKKQETGGPWRVDRAIPSSLLPRACA